MRRAMKRVGLLCARTNQVHNECFGAQDLEVLGLKAIRTNHIKQVDRVSGMSLSEKDKG